MRHVLLFAPALLLAVAAAAVACGGSSSETPWPVEPDPSQLAGPAQEHVTPAAITDGGKPRRP